MVQAAVAEALDYEEEVHVNYYQGLSTINASFIKEPCNYLSEIIDV